MPRVIPAEEPVIGALRPHLQYLPGATLDLHLSPLSHPLRHTEISMLHGLVTAMTAAPHLKHLPRFVLAPSTTSTSGWSVYLPELDLALRLAGRREVVELGRRTVIAETSPARRIPAPAHRWEWSTVLVRTLTPIVLRRSESPTSRNARGAKHGKKFYRSALDASNLLSVLSEWTAERCGLAVWGMGSRIGLRLALNETRADHVNVRGRAVTTGVSGRMVARACPGARWLLEAAQTIGLGGRVGFGFGAVSVKEMPC